MKTEWNLDLLYHGLDDPAYEEDMKCFEDLGAKLHELAAKAPRMEEEQRATEILLRAEEFNRLLMRLSNYIELSLSVDTTNGKMAGEQGRLMRAYSAMTADLTALFRMLGEVSDIDALAEKSDLLKAYAPLMRFQKKDNAHLLSDAEEAMYAAMDITGGSAWSNMQNVLTSTVKADYDGKQVTLSEIRNLAYSPEEAVRKAAYEAEIACYDKIKDAVAHSLNNIKNQVTTIAAQRGFASPLDQSLEQSRMSRQTLEAMMEAVQEYLPVFRKYLRKKGQLLGHEDGLPWYELFAPLEASDKVYSLEECRAKLLDCFGSFAPDMAAMMAEAFDDEWIDFYPREGKSGGAFCAGLGEYKQSRILTNYDGTFGAVDTLAHELGHAYHNRQMEGERELNTDYPMPVAETASTFNEVFLGAYALKRAQTREERLALLESDLREKTQCVVDIYSRYLFETAVFEQSRARFLSADDLAQIMLDCQEQSYGDGLAKDCRHPYMWVCKSHYYSSGFSFYNYPYTFGNLFAQGLYALYQKEGDAFLPRYKEMLRTTSIHTIEEDGKAMGIDLTDKAFWEASLASIAEEIEEFCTL